ncbi:MAG: class I SAM-dependent methyltransferase [Candidatus Binataceae bacterium]
MNSPHLLPFSGRARSLVLASMLATAFALAGCSHKQADAERLAAMLQLKPGMVVADVGAGSGWMTVMLGTLVGPKGHVFSTEIDPRKLGKIRSAVAAAQLRNITVVQSTASDTGLPANCCDAILLRRVYHHLTDPADTDRGLFHALRPGGRLAVLDFRPTILLWPWKPKGLPPNREGHGISPMTVLSEVEHAGFKYDNMVDPWPGSMFLSSYCLTFTKVPAAEAPAAHAPTTDDSIHGAP